MTSLARFERSVVAELARLRGDSPSAGRVRQRRARDEQAARAGQVVVPRIAIDPRSREARRSSRYSPGASAPSERS